MSEPQQKTECREETKHFLFDFWKEYQGAKISGEDRDEVIEKYTDKLKTLLSQSNKNTLEGAIEKIEKFKENILDHHEKYYKDCPRCIEILAHNFCIEKVLSTLQELKEKI